MFCKYSIEKLCNSAKQDPSWRIGKI